MLLLVTSALIFKRVNGDLPALSQTSKTGYRPGTKIRFYMICRVRRQSGDEQSVMHVLLFICGQPREEPLLFYMLLALTPTECRASHAELLFTACVFNALQSSLVPQAQSSNV